MEFLNENLYQMISEDFNALSYASNSPNCLSDEEQLASLNTYSVLDNLFSFNSSNNILNLNDQHHQQISSLTNSEIYTPLSPPLSSSLYDSFNECSPSVSPNWDVNEMINTDQNMSYLPNESCQKQQIKQENDFDLFEFNEPIVKSEQVEQKFQVITISSQQLQQRPQILSVNNTNPTKINIIKINHSPSAATTAQHNANYLKLPITTPTNHPSKIPQPKTILQYKLDSDFKSNSKTDAKVFPKPPYSYSCLIAMAFKNSDTGTLPVSDIYDFIIENFPYYKTARDGWKNSIRHNLSLNKCFEKIENPLNGSKKGCLWGLNPDKCKKIEEECRKCRQRDLISIKLSMSRPDDLMKIERGEQRLKKSTQTSSTSQRKTSNVNTNYNQQSNQIKNIDSDSNINLLNQATDQLLDSFLKEWPNNDTTDCISNQENQNINETCFKSNEFNFDFRLLE